MDEKVRNLVSDYTAALSVLTVEPFDSKYFGKDARFEQYSGFFVELEDHWFWFTSGHCLEGIEYLKNQKIEICRLSDGFGNRKHREEGVPVSLDQFVAFDGHEGWDAGFIKLDSLQTAALKINGIKAFKIDDLIANSEKPNILGFYLVGCPLSLTDYGTSRFSEFMRHSIKSSLVIIFIEPLSDSPEDVTKLNAPRLWAKAHLEKPYEISDIVGMSGGPWIALVKNGAGDLEPKLVGIQSSWVPSKKVIAAVPAAPLLNAFQRTLKSYLSKKAV